MVLGGCAGDDQRAGAADPVSAGGRDITHPGKGFRLQHLDHRHHHRADRVLPGDGVHHIRSAGGPPGAEDLFIVLGARRWQRFIRLAVPAALPRTLVSLRLSIVGAVAGAMLAQWVMGTNGLGYRLIVAQASFRTAEAWACSVVSIALSVVLYSLMSALCRLTSERFE
ncbi:hypothetical protein B1R94_15205 [Mycolicibacterium litorale]|nr:hypothetical protein B1R94_15205 [Mycolicibacterium litorale]